MLKLEVRENAVLRTSSFSIKARRVFGNDSEYFRKIYCKIVMVDAFLSELFNRFNNCAFVTYVGRPISSHILIKYLSVKLIVESF